MPSGTQAGKATISRAGALADALSHFGDSDSEIEQARACYEDLCALARAHGGSTDIRDRLICGALRLAACHARRNELAEILDLRQRLQSHAGLQPDDPGMRRGYCELSVTLCLEYARHGHDKEADATFEEIRAIAAHHPTDRQLRSTLAKAISNRIAAHCDANRQKQAQHLHRSLCALAEVPNSRPDTLLHRANGSFNLATYFARAGKPDQAITLYLDLAAFTDRHAGHPELIEALADAGFALITVFGDGEKLDPAEHIYEDMRQRAALDDLIADKAILGAFNLMTDFCRDGALRKARPVYDDILSHSSARPEDASVALVHAKACANLLLTAEALDDLPQADLLHQELTALIAAWPDHADIWKIASDLTQPESA